ncbi:MAG TPA: histidine kinase dimerization/phosphoacceptor domain -containing protein [Flavobacterium sp.]|mgnify:CR=1 FL=1|nr:histidine kinase dimerization/phosphoacceptor domain -containing protein [Flavobacterium sp.]HPJ09990.1 histidine kinase dimerization/phosphoacceptor domain -containing protein [Flavobacterium sp.]
MNFFLNKALTLLLLCFFAQCATAQSVPKSVSGRQEEQLKLLLDKAFRFIENDSDSATLFIKQAREFSKKHQLNLGEVKVLEAEGSYYGLVKNDYNKATECFHKGVSLCEKNQLNYTKNLYHSLGVMFHVTDNYEKAKSYYLKAVPLERKEKDTLLLVRSLINLGSICSTNGDYTKAEQYFLESLSYPSNFEVRRTTFANLGNMKIREKKFAEALLYLNRVVQIDPETQLGGDAIEYSFLLDAKSAARDFTGLDTILPHANQLYRECPDLRDKSILLKSIGNSYQSMGNFEKAAKLKDEYLAIYDSLKSKQRDEVVYEMEAKYQTQKKEEEIAKQKKEKNRLRLFFTIACFTIALLCFLVYQFFTQKNKLNKQKQLLEIAVDEKNILLKETHHRVKNSFQIVSSLLYLQSENMKDKEAALAVKEAQNRVKSMVLIHQKLYSKDQLIGIETKEYIEDLVNDIIENQTDTIPNLTTQTDVESTVFSVDSVTPLGLIINELITNCIKHAFASGVKNPKITLEFKKHGDGYLLKVSDNGIGFSNEINENSFGIKLIHALAKKLKGKIVFENNGGTHFTMEIVKFEQMS